MKKISFIGLKNSDEKGETVSTALRNLWPNFWS